MGMTERLNIIMTNTEPLNKHVIWLKDDMLKRWTGVGWKNIGGDGSGTTNYNDLNNKPRINGVLLQGDIKLDLGNSVEVIDNLTSTAANKALSANQGRNLLSKINANIINLQNLSDVIDNKADSANTLAGYGITNAYTKTEVNNAISNAIEGLGEIGSVEEIYSADVSKLGTVEFYNDTYQAISSNKLVFINGIPATATLNDDNTITLLLQNNLPDDNGFNLAINVFTIKSDGTYESDVKYALLIQSGDGTKFLNDKGEYVTIESGESYDLATQSSDGLMSKEDKIKLDGLGDASGIILTQAQYDALESYDNVVYFIKG